MRGRVRGEHGDPQRALRAGASIVAGMGDHNPAGHQPLLHALHPLGRVQGQADDRRRARFDRQAQRRKRRSQSRDIVVQSLS